MSKERKKRVNKERTTLTVKEKEVADLWLTGLTYAECYEQSSYSCNGPSWTKENKSQKAKAILDRPLVQAYIEEQRRTVTKKVQWTRERALKTLINVADNSGLTFGGGSQIVSAVREANKMCGFDKPEEEPGDASCHWAIPASAIGKSFSDVNRWVDNGKYSEYWFEGGRGSTKSSYVAQKVLELIEQNPELCAMVMRRVTNTIGDSVYAQLVWAIDEAGLTTEYKCIKSPYEITKKSTGQKIFFRGADDPGKIKSIKPPAKMYIGIQWMEEFDQMAGMESVRNIEQSITRGGEKIFKFKSYNTPKSALHFVNVDKIIPKDKRLIHKSCYTDTPVEWLGQPFIDEADYLKRVNPKAYEHEYLGVAIGNDGMVFGNLELREITKEEKDTFGEEYQGLDWGFYPDPAHWSSCYYKASTQTLYIADEFRVNRTGNKDLYRKLQETKRLNHNTLVTADSAEPKSIQDFTDYGAFIKGTGKFPGSVDYTIKWLATRVKIVIDNVKCPATAKEFSEYELMKDKDGNYISVYPDANNHAIDSVRYAMEPVWKIRGQ